MDEYTALVKDPSDPLSVSQLKAVSRRLIAQLDEKSAVEGIVEYIEKMNNAEKLQMLEKILILKRFSLFFVQTF